MLKLPVNSYSWHLEPLKPNRRNSSLFVQLSSTAFWYVVLAAETALITFPKEQEYSFSLFLVSCPLPLTQLLNDNQYPAHTPLYTSFSSSA